jgi:hypothetical protein
VQCLAAVAAGLHRNSLTSLAAFEITANSLEANFVDTRDCLNKREHSSAFVTMSGTVVAAVSEHVRVPLDASSLGFQGPLLCPCFVSARNTEYMQGYKKPQRLLLECRTLLLMLAQISRQI